MSRLEASFPLYFSNEALKIYDKINVSDAWDFSNELVLKQFASVLEHLGSDGLIVNKLKDFKAGIEKDFVISVTPNKKKVCLAFSGGLDSVYQALYLKEQGYDVYLLHIANLNAYTNGQELKITKAFAEKFNFPLEIIKFHKTGKKIWQENPFKDFLIYSACIDWCISNECNIISSGDDMRLSIEDSIFETNVSDSKELTSIFFDSFKDVHFIPVDASITKDKRLNYLEKFNARDYYDSCVGPGRLTKYLHNKYENQYNVKLDAYNCASCRKCCSHIWYDYVFNGKQYPVELLDRAWKKMSIGADEKFFKGKETFEEKKQALLNY